MKDERNAERTTSSRMIIPKCRGEAIRAIWFSSFILLFLGLAVQNLANRVAVIPSSIWLALVVMALWSHCKENRIRGFLTNCAGAYAPAQFVETYYNGDGTAAIRFGFELFGLRGFYLCVPVSTIACIDWHTGQASRMAGCDMDDWRVALWFDHGDPVKSFKKQGLRKPDQDVYFVGPSGRKEDVSRFGSAFVTFIQDAGASLASGEDGCTFVRNTGKSG